MFYCQDCKREFEEPFVYYEDPSPSGIALPPGFYKYELCPYCKSDWINEVADEEETES